ncbi:hypothetical protein NQD34_002182 [Periophthalmus magnuspinnatus]|nr:hypothetical protein NQD34_002182 [Periophthalmus magnuspinnatus]
MSTMTDPTKLLVILGKNNAVKLALPSGIPKTLEDLKMEIQKQCSLTGDFRLQYMDNDFNEFLNLTSTTELKNMDKVKVVISARVPEPDLEVPKTPCSSFCSPNSSPGSCRWSVDTDILSSSTDSPPSSSHSSSSLRIDPWPSTFTLPTFSYTVDLQLKKANDEFLKTGALFTPPPKLKSDIMQSLASEILRYKPYPSDIEFDDVCKALIGTYPFLRELGSETGYSAWKITLKQKMGNYRSNLRNMGCSELKINSLKRRGDVNVHPNQVKKARRAEVNFCPDYPAGEDKESQEEDRVALLSEVQKRNNDELIKRKMERTFPHRRQEIVRDMPFIADFKSRWPALFSHREVCHVGLQCCCH